MCHKSTRQSTIDIMTSMLKLISRSIIYFADLASTSQQDIPYISDIKLSEDLPSRGSSFADVYLGEWTGKLVAVKRPRIFYSTEREKLHEEIICEARRWQDLKHDNILEFYGISRDTLSPFIGLVIPWIELGNVLNHLKAGNEMKLPMLRIANEVASALCYLHGRGVVHGDLSPSNVLLCEDGSIKLSNYGLAPFVDVVTATMTAAGHPGVRRMAPELHHPQKFGLECSERTFKTDVYAFAMFCLELYTLKPPFAEIRQDTAVIFKAIEGQRPHRPSESECKYSILPEWLWVIMQRCWEHHPDKRPLMDKVSEEMWVDAGDYHER